MQPTTQWLDPTRHDRDYVGLTYVYPVISRRAGGVSIGINLNPNNACNWRCIYCQVPDLKRGAAPVIDLEILEKELRDFLQELVWGQFMQTHVPPEARIIKDICLSGNGEPTSAREFEQVIILIGRIIADFPLPRELKLVLITNGSLIYRPHIQSGLRHMAQLNGEVWFKLDGVNQSERFRINHTRIGLSRVHENLKIAASLCPTWLQTCVFKFKEMHLDPREISAYLQFIATLLQEDIPIRGVFIYTLARPALQPEVAHLSKADPDWMEDFANQVRVLGLPVKTAS